MAAGGGRRFPPAAPKALVRFEEELLVERGARLLQAGGAAPVVVVRGAAAAEVAARADLTGVEMVVNAGWEEGIGSSLRTGLGHLAGRREAEAAVIHLCDQPLVRAAAVERLIEAWRHGAVVAMATFDGQRRNPVLLDRSVWSGVCARAVGDVGARAYLGQHPEIVTAIACDDVASSLDIDEPEDFERLAGPTA